MKADEGFLPSRKRLDMETQRGGEFAPCLITCFLSDPPLEHSLQQGRNLVSLATAVSPAEP